MADEQMEKEREKAMESLNSMLKSNKGTKPRNFREGLNQGVSNIVGGAVGAAGVAVLAPTVGAAQGVKNGGLLGGLIGVTGGAVVGVVGAVGFAVGGAVTGVSQIVQGTAAIPKAVKAQSKGQWWNEVEGRWVSTNLQEEGEAMRNVPNNDKDILEKIENKIEESIRPEGGTGNVKDMHYYNVLEIDAAAEPSAIKRRYYVLARKYHPDKVGADDKEAANKFKDIAEAYQVLSDPTLRSKYDKEGMDGLSADKTSTAEGAQPKVDPALLFAFLFGSDQFKDYLGRLATATSASIGDSNELSPADARMLQLRRVKRLSFSLAAKLQAWVDAGSDTEAQIGCTAKWLSEARELSTASYGIQLVHTIGQVYSLAAAQFLGSLDSGIGLPSISKWASAHHARIKSQQAVGKNAIDGITTGMDMMAVQAEFEKKMKEAKTDEEREAATKEMEKAASENLLKVLWTTTVVDITSTLHEVAQMVFFDESVDKKVRKLRGYGLKALGETFMECPAPEKEGGEEEMDAKAIYEEAAFNAMLETMKRKDEATFRASTTRN